MNRTNLTLALAALGLLANVRAAHAVTAIVENIGLFGPKGEVISYEKQGDAIHVRVCKNNTLKSEIESDSGCELADGTWEVTLSESVFRARVSTVLATIDGNTLSVQQRQILERDLTDLNCLEREREQLADLQKKLRQLENFKAENPHDYDPNEETNLKDQIQRIEKDLSGYTGIVDAKNQVAGIVDQLIADMDGKPTHRILRNSQDGNGIAYNLLRALATVDACDSLKVAYAPIGYMCSFGNKTMWKVENETYEGKRVYRDMKSGLKVTELMGYANQYVASANCTNGYRLPSGYPSEENGENGLPNQDSDFVTLENDGILQVVLGVNGGRPIWSSSSSNNNESVYVFLDGQLYPGQPREEAMITPYVNSLCVSGP